MGLFHDTLGGLDAHEGLSVPETFGPDITSAYDADLAAATEAATAAATADIAAIITQAATEAVTAAVTAMKAEAFDAALAAPTDVVADDSEFPGAADTDADIFDGEIVDEIDGFPTTMSAIFNRA
jgi:hypothetical protein